MGMRGIRPDLEGWQLDLASVRSRMYLAPTPRERERWHALWLLCRGLSASGTAQALGRDARTIGRWVAAFGEGGPAALIFEQTGGSPPPALGETQQAELTGAVQELPEMSGIEMANWTLRQAQEESGAAVCLEAFRHWPEPQRLPELSAPLGVCPEASQEASGQGR